MLYQIIIFLIEVAVTLVGGACLLRLYMRWRRMPMANPVGHFVQALSDWLVLPLRRVIRPSGKVDLSCLLGAVLVLPQGIAFATLAGLPPEYGLYTAVVPCIIAALFGSSWHVMSGPTNANSLALFAMLSPLAVAFSPAYIQLALAVTVMVGVLQWLIGALRLGMLANFMSPSVLFGFTSGAALLIAVAYVIQVQSAAWYVKFSDRLFGPKPA